ncbi:MAG: GTP 3',8-cyclase MoaA [Planctomycetes bacterium]|nr:GTP 3',8-cyclase MoaA [Planctomycetota bacterium]
MHVKCLRISVTDRCNLRCVYCRPLHDCSFIEDKEILTFEEIHRLVRLFADCGIDRVRLTGGEPLLRKNITSLIAKLAAIKGIRELTLTTNGVLLLQMADELKAAGLDRVNVSIDSLEADNYRQITGYDFMSRVVLGIEKAIEAGLQPVKINAVILRGINHSQITALAGMSIDLPVTVRFIEYCPTSMDTQPADDYMPYGEIHRIIERTFGPLSDATIEGGSGPALNFKIKNSAGAVGFIAGRSTIFCETCNRIRLTSNGKIKPCLYSAQDYDIQRLIREGTSDDHIRNLLQEVIVQKHAFTKLNSSAKEFSMRKVGG